MTDFNAQANEYGQVEDKLKSLHETQLKNINTVYMNLKLLSGTNGGFYVEATSKKINKLLDIVADELLPGMAVVFSRSEKIMDNFFERIKSIDKE